MAKRAGNIPWSDEEDQFHRNSISSGMKPEAVAKAMTEKFGREFTRNAVMGRAHRQGIQNSQPAVILKSKKLYSAWTPEQDDFIRAEFTAGKKLIWVADEFFARFHVIVDRWVLRTRLGQLGAYKKRQVKSTRGVMLPKETAPQRINIVEHDPATSVPTSTLGPGMCKWPTNDAATAACGASVSMGAYCSHHAAIAYRAPPTAKRQKVFNRRNQYD